MPGPYILFKKSRSFSDFLQCLQIDTFIFNKKLQRDYISILPCAGGENRTPDSTLEESYFTTKLHPHFYFFCHLFYPRQDFAREKDTKFFVSQTPYPQMGRAVRKLAKFISFFTFSPVYLSLKKLLFRNPCHLTPVFYAFFNF